MKVKVKKLKVYVGLSGGVDSSVSAALLKMDGFDVTGVFIRVWQPDWLECTWREDRLDAMRVCAKLEIPFVELNFEKEYKKEVVDYMIREYKAGRTPNPDVMCNKHVKFGAFYNWAMKRGADYVATGHYARIGFRVEGVGSSPKRKEGKKLNPTPYTLLVGADSNKDQSYFLWQIKAEQLPHILFPVGGLEKPEVRKLAKKFGLVTADKKDSQGLCFMGRVDMKDFLKRYIKPKAGKVLSENGKIIGRHQGAQFFTLGERHGFTIDAEHRRTDADERGSGNQEKEPYYVICKDIQKNTLTVSNDPIKGLDGSSRKIFEIEQVNWFGDTPKSGVELQVRLRYRQPLQNAQVIIRDSKFIIQFESAQSGGASGQSIVLYDGDRCLGGGIIV